MVGKEEEKEEEWWVWGGGAGVGRGSMPHNKWQDEEFPQLKRWKRMSCLTGVQRKIVSMRTINKALWCFYYTWFVIFPTPPQECLIPTLKGIKTGDSSVPTWRGARSIYPH